MSNVTPSSGNVFADLGFDNPAEELMKAKLAREIRAAVAGRELMGCSADADHGSTGQAEPKAKT